MVPLHRRQMEVCLTLDPHRTVVHRRQVGACLTPARFLMAVLVAAPAVLSAQATPVRWVTAARVADDAEVDHRVHAFEQAEALVELEDDHPVGEREERSGAVGIACAGITIPFLLLFALSDDAKQRWDDFLFALQRNSSNPMIPAPSFGPPAAKGTIMRIGRIGYDCAWTSAVEKTAKSASSTREKTMTPPVFELCDAYRSIVTGGTCRDTL